MQKSQITQAIIFQVVCFVLGTMVALILSLNGIVLGKELSIFPAITLALLIIILLVEIISVYNISDSTVHTVLIAAATLAVYLSSVDFMGFLEWFGISANYFAASIAQFVCYHGVILACVNFLNFTYRLSISKKGWVTILSGAAINCVLYGVLSIFGVQYIAFALWLPLCLVIFIKAYKSVATNGRVDYIFFLTTTLMSMETGMRMVEEFNVAGVLTCGVSGFSTIYTLLVVSTFGIVYLTFIFNVERKSLKAEEYRLQAELMKTKVLQQQINPHYIYNALTTVKEMYHRDCESGDFAISLFAKHLRANVNGMAVDLIPFDDEIEIIQNYIGFENLKRKEPLNVIYNIEFSDFRVPPLSLQVFVENAVKHGRVGDMPDGTIEISAFENGDEIIVGVTDNGVGFNAEKIGDKSCGISNSRARFSLLLGGRVEINGKIGEGTSVIVRLDRRTAALTANKEGE